MIHQYYLEYYKNYCYDASKGEMEVAKRIQVMVYFLAMSKKEKAIGLDYVILEQMVVTMMMITPTSVVLLDELHTMH